jgi:hypothetical protein
MYIADALYFVAESQGMVMSKRWSEFVHPEPVKECDENPEEIKQRIMTKLRGMKP